MKENLKDLIARMDRMQKRLALVFIGLFSYLLIFSIILGYYNYDLVKDNNSLEKEYSLIQDTIKQNNAQFLAYDIEIKKLAVEIVDLKAVKQEVKIVYKTKVVYSDDYELINNKYEINVDKMQKLYERFKIENKKPAFILNGSRYRLIRFIGQKAYE